MIKLPASVAALFILTVAAIPQARACDEYCGEAQEAAYERAYEQQAAREEAAEEGYYGSQRRGYSQSGSRRGSAARSAPSAQRQAAEPESKSGTSTRTRQRGQDREQDYDVANENSSIAGGSDEVASDDSFERRPVKSSGERRSGKAVGCKTYFPSVGMTLSVPCD
jgi:hypothetical protein